MKQTTLGSTDWALKTKVTRRSQFLAELDAVAPRARPLEGRNPLLKSATIVGATIIAVPPPTGNAAKERDPEMKQTRKGKQRRFGMKLHVGTDRRALGGHACRVVKHRRVS